MVAMNYFDELLNYALNTTVLNLPIPALNNLEVYFENNLGLETVPSGNESALPFASSNVFYTEIAYWRRLSAASDDCKPVYEVTLDVTDSGFKFSPGDTIGIIPKNKTDEVDFILTHLGLTSQADLTCIITETKPGKSSKYLHLPAKSNLRHILTNCVDIRAVLKKIFIIALSKYTEQENERKILEYLSSKEGSTAYNTHILNKNICLIDLFRRFPSCKPPIEVILSHFPRLLPRPYSIVNSGLSSLNIIKICFSVIDIGNERKGLTTSWLEDTILKETLNKESTDLSIEEMLKGLELKENTRIKEKIPIYLRKNLSNFSMPKDLETPLLLIGPGTGVAPYIGFLEERKILKEKNPEVKLGSTHLYFGCRNPDLDFLYKKEMDDFISSGILNKLRTAFSRIETKERYIQDLLHEDGKEIVQFIESGASIYVCGDLNSMATQIRDALVKCFVDHINKSEEEALKYISELQKNNKYLIDMWS